MDRDDDLRSSCFASLDVLCATHGYDIPYRGGLAAGIHHRAFDQNLVGVSPDYVVHVSSRLLDDEDGPMLALKTFHEEPIVLPRRTTWRPDRDQLAERFERFRAV
jgi:putative restriction endonuclease